jgi:hypothetical protein
VLIVDEMSGTRMCDSAPVAMNKNHADIVKPTGREDDSYIFLKNHWRELVGRGASAGPGTPEGTLRQ